MTMREANCKAEVPAEGAVVLSQQDAWWGRAIAAPEAPVHSANLSLRGLVEALFRHQRIFGRVFAAVTVLTIVVTAITPKAFESRMKILVENARKNVSITPEKTERVMTNDAVTEEEINSEVELIDSNDLLQSVSQKIDGTLSDPARFEGAVSSLQKRLKIEPVRKSNVIEVEFTDKSPERARQVLQMLSAEYLNKHLQLQRPSGAFEFFRSQAEGYRQRLEQAEQQLADFEKSRNFVALGEKKEVLMKQIDQAQDEIHASDATVHEIDRRLKTNEELEHRISPRIPTQARVVPNQYAAQTLGTMLVELKNRRTSMLTKFRPDDRLVKELDEQIDSTTEALDRMSKGSATETTSDVNSVWQELNAERAKDEIMRNGQAARRATLAQQMQDSQAELANLQTLTVDYDALARNVQELDANYKTFADKRDEAQIADAMDQQKLLNVAIAEPPTLSATAVRPKVLLNLVLGLFTAMFMACCAVFVAELMREDIRTPQELEAVRGYPVLATTPLQFSRRVIADTRGYELSPSPEVERSAAQKRVLSAGIFRRRGAPDAV